MCEYNYYFQNMYNCYEVLSVTWLSTQDADLGVADLCAKVFSYLAIYPRFIQDYLESGQGIFMLDRSIFILALD